jgi:2-polyprenyl-6-methoxyphenol hydroxylase-like FAD-dependent oxidoreductase
MVTSILISGAGIAGPTLAFWLKAAGFEPTLVERAPGLRTGGYVIDFGGLRYDIAAADGRYQEAFTRYDTLLRSYIGAKQRGAERFAGAFAPKTRVGLAFRNMAQRLCHTGPSKAHRR